MQEFITWVVAAVALYFAYRAASAAGETNELQRRQIASLEEKDRRDQADRLAVWIQVVAGGGGIMVGTPAGIHPAREVPVYAVRNGSQLPVNSVLIYCYSPFVGECRRPPKGKHREFFDVVSKRIIPPNEVASSILTSREIASAWQMEAQEVGIFFKDATGAAWERGISGKLRAMDEAQATLLEMHLTNARDRLEDGQTVMDDFPRGVR